MSFRKRNEPLSLPNAIGTNRLNSGARPDSAGLPTNRINTPIGNQQRPSPNGLGGVGQNNLSLARGLSETSHASLGRPLRGPQSAQISQTAQLGQISRTGQIGQISRIPGAHARATNHKTGPSNNLDSIESPAMSNTAYRPSPVTSQNTVSTGAADLDKILIHQGLPLSTSLLVEESGTTDFSSVLLRAFTTQGVIHSRLEKTGGNCHVIVIGVGSGWSRDLPGVYKGNSKEQKKAKIRENESVVSVSNVVEQDLKIAWRYGLNRSESADPSGPTDTGISEDYITQFDITLRLLPTPNGQEMSFVPLVEDYSSIVSQVQKLVHSHSQKGKYVRLVLPGFLNPSLYPPECCSPAFIIPLVHSLRSIVSGSSAVLMASVPLDLYPRGTVLMHTLETLFDGAVHLQPFNSEMSALLERTYKNEPTKIHQGLVNILKIPVLSERGMMMISNGEYAFRNSRKRFTIEEWGIPVEDTEEESKIDF